MVSADHKETPRQDDMSEAPSQAAALELKRIRKIAMAILFLLLAMVAYFAKDLLLPLVLGVLVFLILSPVARTLVRVGIPAPITAFLLIGALAAGAAVAVTSLALPVGQFMDDAPSIGREVRVKLSGVLQSLEAVSEASKEVEDMANGASGEQVERVVIEQPGLLSSAVSNLASAGSSFVAALILALFLLASGDMFLRKTLDVLPRLEDKKKALRIVRDIELQISRYLASITAINAALGVAVGLAMWVLGMPTPLLWGVAAFILNFLPFIGALIGAGLAAAVAIVTFDSLPYAALAPTAYLMLSSIEGQMITPMLVGRRLELNTIAVLIAVAFWIWMWGVIGALMAVPLLVLFKVICDNRAELRNAGHFLSSTGAAWSREENGANAERA